MFFQFLSFFDFLSFSFHLFIFSLFLSFSRLCCDPPFSKVSKPFAGGIYRKFFIFDIVREDS